MKAQMSKEQYFRQTYDTKGRFISYWHQISEVFSLQPKRVLEVGIGNGLVSEYLKGRKVNVSTVDIDHELFPDIVANVSHLPYKDSSFQVAMCCEVLEHLPFDNFSICLKELSRVSHKYLILSLPDASPSYKFFIEIPKFKRFKTIIPHPLPKVNHHVFTGEHYWEIGKSLYPLKRIFKDIEKSGLEIKKTYRIYEYRFHRFFILKKK